MALRRSDRYRIIPVVAAYRKASPYKRTFARTQSAVVTVSQNTSAQWGIDLGAQSWPFARGFEYRKHGSLPRHRRSLSHHGPRTSHWSQSLIALSALPARIRNDRHSPVGKIRVQFNSAVQVRSGESRKMEGRSHYRRRRKCPTNTLARVFPTSAKQRCATWSWREVSAGRGCKRAVCPPRGTQ